MSAGLHHMSQAPSGSDPARSRMDPAVQAQATALKMLAARADHLRDRIGTLLQTVQQDPVGDRTRQSMYPWQVSVGQVEGKHTSGQILIRCIC